MTEDTQDNYYDQITTTIEAHIDMISMMREGIKIHESSIEMLRNKIRSSLKLTKEMKKILEEKK